ncbi:hypothetical protein RHSIM_Rhsim04G0175200 [Rhododendron simsii]|uniref:Retroviral polymerase SH3-like domain-containing protein n=1 Tax=Rhododendron simsii TaxID=118357 RepID=A0A834H7I7_RHOSS|nr:hypothetical protein RHSIM_Rhsim04G0175200 [Rhododendron simsii]
MYSIQDPFREDTSRNSAIEWHHGADEQDSDRACAEHANTRRVAQAVLGRCNQCSNILNQPWAFSFVELWDTEGGLERDKLDAKSLKCTFVGYGGVEFGHHFWDEKNRKIIKSRDVIFNESMLYKDRDSKKCSGSSIEGHDGPATEVLTGVVMQEDRESPEYFS